ncbi:ABC-F family ATP-binding cassette domain-containing protein [Mesoterricola sediminis]|uniref:ABC-F family ATPase n=1 Tax=Mesoterricola sediminis TaxID=2927980 RepID=A0AA48GVB9_9BACT|nr:ATP-binding cassette domain-containing protein [Mesoterricola sediminis]BDU78297.1 ABC-F family ATPase [Mesoterricola sediminis]
MLGAQNVTMRFGARILFEDVTTTFAPGRRYGLTGPNGSGKSTFIKLFTGEQEPSSGTIQRPRKMGVLAQDQFAFDAFRVIDTVIMGNKGLWAALQERDAIYEKAEMTDEDGMRLGELEGIVADEDGYTAEADAAILLDGLGVPEAFHERTMGELQGGQKVRVLLAQALFGNPEALLLDEPTNHLDLDSIHWLENFLQRYKGSLVVISHDRHFLNSICTHIADIDYQTIIQYSGGYDDMVVQKMQIRSRLEAENTQREKKIAQLNEFIQRFAAGTRSSQVASRRKEVERLTPNDLARSNIQRPYIMFSQAKPGGRHAVEFEDVSRGYDLEDGSRLEVIRGFSANVARGEKIAVVGRNGAGKSTLIKALLANAPGVTEADRGIDAGTVKWGHEVNVGYFAQDFRESIPGGHALVDWLRQFDPDAMVEQIRGVLGQMLFRGEEGMKRTEVLSGGEGCRLMFCKLMLQKPNFLVLDEPTNHLDLEAVIALNTALQRYEGTVILVTHDEDLIDEVATRIWNITDDGIEDFQGSFSEFQAHKGLS